MEVYMKKCSVCKETKELDQFDRRSRANGDKVPTGRCKACRRIYMKSYTKKKGKTGLTREEWLKSVRKPRLSREERVELGKLKWEAWYQEEIKRAEERRKAIVAKGVLTCTNCNKELPLSQFPKRKRKRKNGSHYLTYKTECKTCKNKKAALHRASPKGRAAIKAYYASPKGKAKRKRERAIREKRNKLATPKWLTKEQKKKIVDTYEDMRRYRDTTGEEYHVDHIIPIRGKNVCGLHVPWNLRVIKASDNISKSNEITESIYTESDVT